MSVVYTAGTGVLGWWEEEVFRPGARCKPRNCWLRSMPGTTTETGNWTAESGSVISQYTLQLDLEETQPWRPTEVIYSCSDQNSDSRKEEDMVGSGRDRRGANQDSSEEGGHASVNTTFKRPKIYHTIIT